MKYDFYSSQFLKGGISVNKAESECETLPLTVNFNGRTARNYRIYGNDGGVGDMDSDTEKYIVPVTVSGRNLLENTRVGRSTAVEYTVNSDGSVTFNGTASARVDFYIVGAYSSTDNILSEQDVYVCSCTTDKTVSNGVQFLVGYNTTTYAATAVNTDYSLTTSQISYFAIRIPSGTTLENVTFYPMICRAGYSDNDFVPYYKKTIAICLDEPLNDGDYIDFREQKRCNDDDTEEIVYLPALPVIKGFNSIDVGTTVEPAKVYVQGSLSAVQRNVLELNNVPNSISDIEFFQTTEWNNEVNI